MWIGKQNTLKIGWEKDNCEVYLKVFPNQKDFQPIRENLGLRSEICAVFRMIERAERIMKKNNYWVHLTVYKDGSYVYNDDYIPEVNKKAWVNSSCILVVSQWR